MNILYCGDDKIRDGLLISILSLVKQVDDPLHIYILTAEIKTKRKTFFPLQDKVQIYLDQLVKEKNPQSFVKLFDISSQFNEELPKANMNTVFTPCCMLRLFADRLDLPDRLLYLDTDIICRQNFKDFYEQDLDAVELVGVLDYYGRWFFKQHYYQINLDYLNSGLLLLNLAKIKETGLFARARQMCIHKKMFMPDQSSLNKLAKYKRIAPRRFNEQRKLQADTVFQHFTTSLRFFPWFHTLTVKPWDVERMHSVLNLHEYDDILKDYQYRVKTMED